MLRWVFETERRAAGDEWILWAFCAADERESEECMLITHKLPSWMDTTVWPQSLLILSIRSRAVFTRRRGCESFSTKWLKKPRRVENVANSRHSCICNTRIQVKYETFSTKKTKKLIKHFPCNPRFIFALPQFPLTSEQGTFGLSLVPNERLMPVTKQAQKQRQLPKRRDDSGQNK